MAGKQVKELYERQQDTNAFTDRHKAAVDGLVVRDNVVFTPLYNHDDITDMPDNSMCMCIYKNEIVYKVKMNGTTRMVKPLVAEEHPAVSMQVSETGVQVDVQSAF